MVEMSVAETVEGKFYVSFKWACNEKPVSHLNGLLNDSEAVRDYLNYLRLLDWHVKVMDVESEDEGLEDLI